MCDFSRPEKVIFSTGRAKIYIYKTFYYVKRRRSIFLEKKKITVVYFITCIISESIYWIAIIVTKTEWVSKWMREEKKKKKSFSNLFQTVWNQTLHWQQDKSESERRALSSRFSRLLRGKIEGVSAEKKERERRDNCASGGGLCWSKTHHTGVIACQIDPPVETRLYREFFFFFKIKNLCLNWFSNYWQAKKNINDFFFTYI